MGRAHEREAHERDARDGRRSPKGNPFVVVTRDGVDPFVVLRRPGVVHDEAGFAVLVAYDI